MSNRDYERGFAEGFERGFKAGRISAQPYVKVTSNDCGCASDTACGNLSCPRLTRNSPAMAGPFIGGRLGAA